MSGGWIASLKRMFRRAREDEISLLSAGVAFFVCLGVFPGLAATVFILQTIADASQLKALVDRLSAVLPQDASQILTAQIRRMSSADAGQAGPGVSTPVVGYAVLLWSASRGTRAIVQGLDRIYDRGPERGFLNTLLVAVTLTVCLIVFLLASIAIAVLAPYFLEYVGFQQGFALLRWPLLLIMISGALALLYRFATRRVKPDWTSITLASVFAAVLWVVGSMLFSWYLKHVGNLPFIYGSVSAIVGFLIWTWISVLTIMIGAEVDAEMSARRIRKISG